MSLVKRRHLSEAQRMGPHVITTGRARLAAGSLAALATVGILAGAMIAGDPPFRFARLISEPFRMTTTGETRIVATDPLTLEEARTRTGIALPPQLGTWAFAAATQRTAALELEYRRAGARDLIVLTQQLSARPGLLVGGLTTREVSVGASRVVLVWGDSGPVGPPPAGAVVDRESLTHRIRAAFELGATFIILIADDRDVTEAQMVDLVAQIIAPSR